MKTKVEIINETVEYYKTHDRAVDDQYNCSYFLEGKMCAVGRCCIDPKGVEAIYSGKIADGLPLNTILKKEYRGHIDTFWRSLQVLHDTPDYWDGHELSDKGKSFVQQLLITYGV